MTAKPHFPNLDASRFLAFILVFFAHCFIPGNYNFEPNSLFYKVVNYSKLGFLGLEYFFVLSSFLITYLLISEIELKKKLEVSSFLIRRALRVWPLYFAIVLLGYGLYLLSMGSEEMNIESLPSVFYFITFTINFYAMENGMNFLFFMAFLWSISIEEQFYLFWALLMSFYRKNGFLLICLLLILASLLFRFVNIDNDGRLYFHTVSTLANFGVGAMAAYLAFYKQKIFRAIVHLQPSVIRLFYLLLVGSIICFHLLRSFEFFIIIQRLFYAVLFAFFILVQSFAERPLFEPGKIRQFNYLGKISYGLYCYHGVVITIIIKLLDYSNLTTNPLLSYFVFPILIFAASVLFAHVSYLYLERPFLTLKKRFSVL